MGAVTMDKADLRFLAQSLRDLLLSNLQTLVDCNWSKRQVRAWYERVEAQLDNPTPEPAPALTCSCGECHFVAGRWMKQHLLMPQVKPGATYATACPVCGDLLRAGGERVAMVELEVAAELLGAEYGTLDMSPARGRWTEIRWASMQPLRKGGD